MSDDYFDYQCIDEKYQASLDEARLAASRDVGLRIIINKTN